MSTATPKSHSSTIDQTCLSAASVGSEHTEMRRARPAASSHTWTGSAASERYGPEGTLTPADSAASARAKSTVRRQRVTGTPRTASESISTASSLAPNRASKGHSGSVTPRGPLGSARKKPVQLSATRL